MPFFLHRSRARTLNESMEDRHPGRDCPGPDYMDVFKLAIYGTGYSLPRKYDELLEHLMSALT